MEPKIDDINILIVEDDSTLTFSMSRFLAMKGIEADFARTGEEARKLLNKKEYDIAFLDMMLPDEDGMDLIPAITMAREDCKIFVITGLNDAERAVAAIKRGATDYLVKPVPLDKIYTAILNSAEALKQKRYLEYLQNKQLKANLIGEHPSMQKVKRDIDLVSRHPNTNILIVGESGTGKELVATIIASRSSGPFVTVSCPALPETLFESELFGHVKGAFTGASSRRRGLMELARGGTLLLDEISDIPMTLQAKLLRVIETKKFLPVGGEKELSLESRIVTTSNRPLSWIRNPNNFRQDLFYRIAAFIIELPPLRERGDDVLLLADFFLASFNQRSIKKVRGFSEGARKLLLSYHWPGNARELRNMVETAAIRADSDIIKEEHFQFLTDKEAKRGEAAVKDEKTVRELTKLEAEEIEKALQVTSGNISRAAKLLGISRTTLTGKIKRLGLKTGIKKSSG